MSETEKAIDPKDRAALIAEAELMAQWCDEQIPLQREQMARAAEVVNIFATEHHAAQTIGPDPKEVAFRSECANNFWRIAKLLRSTVAALREAEQDRERLRDAVEQIAADLRLSADEDDPIESDDVWRSAMRTVAHRLSTAAIDAAITQEPVKRQTVTVVPCPNCRGVRAEGFTCPRCDDLGEVPVIPTQARGAEGAR